MGSLNRFKAGQTTHCSLPLNMQVASEWPGHLHAPGLPLPWSHGAAGYGGHPGQTLQQVLELENVDRESLRTDEEWLEPGDVRVEGRVVIDMASSIY